ncbi:MAG: saccharopine dehydrogenase NADP-binding domain-containing protein [Halieaceae bacterium]|nr:saccharopine dehydrogenase NADP-binding domain-containing protein [Halieaceae bacterium]
MKKKRVLILGTGKIGSLIACLLSASKGYELDLASRRPEVASALIEDLQLDDATACGVDAADTAALGALMGGKHYDAVVSALPFHRNIAVAELAAAHAIHYFDLTEDIAVTRRVREISEGADTVFMPQCGLAPGFINIVANELMGRFTALDTVKLRVGALPQNSANMLKYALLWSTEGVINEYCEPCEAIVGGQPATLMPLEGLETISLDGVVYEAFNTSGGLGNLAQAYQGRVQSLDYKSIRYPGHCQAFRLLLNDLKLNRDRDTLQRILENALPATVQDVVLVYVSASGKRDGAFVEDSFVRKIYPQQINGRTWSAIQVATAAGLCSVLDIVLSDPQHYRGFVPQQSIPLSRFMETPYGHYYD